MNIRNMEIIRTIHPVGQGGFYTETLESDSDKHTVVYDCGGSSKKSMEEYLKKYLHKDSSGNRMEIDAVFISHLHADHINGLEYLLKNADVKYLILPQLTNEMILEALVYNRIQSNRAGTQINNLVLDLYGENDHYGTTKIIKVEFAGLEDRINIEQEGDEVDLSGDVKVGIVKSKTIFCFKSEPIWVYIPYNPPANIKKPKQFEDFAKELQPYIGFSVADAPKRIKSHVDDCQKIYEKFFGKNHNVYSMTLFSGFKDYRASVRYWCMNSCCFDCGCCCDCTPSCLFTGDFEPKSFINNLKFFYDPIWKQIGSIQVPHHGSRLNYHPELYKVAQLGFVSVGEKNSHDHPSIDTLINIRSKNCVPIVVTDNMSSIRLFQYHFELKKRREAEIE